jgi:hypothetical protein
MKNGLGMARYVVKIDERFTHELTVEADDRDAAIAAAYKLLTDGMSKDEEVQMDYVFESDGFTGQNDAWSLD